MPGKSYFDLGTSWGLDGVRSTCAFSLMTFMTLQCSIPWRLYSKVDGMLGP